MDSLRSRFTKARLGGDVGLPGSGRDHVEAVVVAVRDADARIQRADAGAAMLRRRTVRSCSRWCCARVLRTVPPM